MNRVLVVSASAILRIVVGRTIERIYLKPIPTPPEAAPQALTEHNPVMVIIDEDTRETLLRPLLSALVRKRNASTEGLPRVLLIEEPNPERTTPPLSGLADASVAKPITPDILQPVAERLLAR